MGYVGYFYVESKSYKLRYGDGNHFVKFTEWGKANLSTDIMGITRAIWLSKMMNELVPETTGIGACRDNRERDSVMFLQKRMNKYGKYMEITEFGQGGRRGFIVIPEGSESQGWRQCISQLGRLLKHLNLVRDANEKKTVRSVPTRAVVPGRTFADVVEGKQLLGQRCGEQVVKPLVEVQSEKSLVNLAGEKIKVAGEGLPKTIMEGAQIKEVTAGNHAMQQMKNLEYFSKEDFTRGLKEILISFQKEIASCLYKLEMGCESKKSTGQVRELVGQVDLNCVKGGTTSQAGLGISKPSQVLESVDQPTRQQITNRYHKIYVRRHPPRRQLRWRPKLKGRKEQIGSEEVSKTCRSSSSEQIAEAKTTDTVDGSGGHDTKAVFGCSVSAEEAPGGVAVVEFDGQGDNEAERADEQFAGHFVDTEVVGQTGGQQTKVIVFAGDIAGAAEEVKAGGQTVERVEEVNLSHIVEAEAANKIEGQEVQLLDTTGDIAGAIEEMESGGQEAERAEDGIISHTEAVGGVGKLGGQEVQVLDIAGDTAGVSAVTVEVPEGADDENFSYIRVVGVLGQGMEELGEERGVEKGPGDGNKDEGEAGEKRQLTRVMQKPPIDISEGAGSSNDNGPCPGMFEKERNLGAEKFVNGEDGSAGSIPVSRSWVIDSCIEFYPKIGVTCEGENDKMEALLNDIEASREQPVTEMGGIFSCVTATRGSRELKSLDCSVNYDKGLSKAKQGKGRGRGRHGGL
jgi:hypothetical protein